MEFLEDRTSQGHSTLALKGDWTVGNAAAIEAAVNAHERKPAELDASGLGRLDTAGAWLIQKYFANIKIANMSERQQALMEFVPDEKLEPAKKPGLAAQVQFFVDIGKHAAESCTFLFSLFSFIGEVFVRLFRNIAQPSHFRLPAIARHIHETGVQALPIIGLLGFGISMVISYQGATQLRKFGADIFTIDLTVISLLREMAVLTTAIMFAGRSGSAFAAEIGVSGSVYYVYFDAFVDHRSVLGKNRNAALAFELVKFHEHLAFANLSDICSRLAEKCVNEG